MPQLDRTALNDKSLLAWEADIRSARINHASCNLKKWLKLTVDAQASCQIRHQQILKQYQILLDVICDDCLPLLYRQLCLELINYPLFELRECEALESLAHRDRFALKQINNLVFNEFKVTFAFFRKSLRR